MNIEKELFPECDELVNDNGTLKAQIIDAEIDPIECTFNNDFCVKLDTSKLSYITLSVQNLETLIELILKAEEKYSSMD